MKTFFTYSFGCRVNEAEKEEIDRKMILSGYKFDSLNPDIFIINTCSVTHKAEREARQLIYQTKKNLPNTKIVVTGCSATYWLKNKLYNDLKVDMIIDNVNKEFLVNLIKKRLLDQPAYNRSGCTRANRTILNEPIFNKFIGSGRMMIKIQDGCQRYCTFCIVPYLRGMPNSTKIEDIIYKVKNLYKNNHLKEIILTAINTKAFGFDTKESFVDLLRSAIKETNIPRISLGSIHPWSLNEDFFEFYKKYISKNRLINFFHIPLQSGSNKILILMKRGYNREEMLVKLNRIKQINPYAFLATDIIVGFLEENDADFKETYEFLKKSPISKFHVFKFSKRVKTSADYMAKRLKEPSSKEKAERANRLIELSEKKYHNFMKQNIGRTSPVLFLEKTINGLRESLLDNQLPIWVDSKTTYPGEIKNVKVIEYKKRRLFGKII